MDEIDELHVHENAFKRMHNLRFLKIFSNKYMLEKKVRQHLPDSFDYLPPKLKLLCWDGYPMKSMPSNFHPENLVKLKMENSNLKKLWEGTRVSYDDKLLYMSLVMVRLEWKILVLFG